MLFFLPLCCICHPCFLADTSPVDGYLVGKELVIMYSGRFMWCSVLSFLYTLGLAVQNFDSLTMSLSPQFVNYISTSKANTLLFSVEKM